MMVEATPYKQMTLSATPSLPHLQSPPTTERLKNKSRPYPQGAKTQFFEKTSSLFLDEVFFCYSSQAQMM
jgi:hypothetical protein